MILSCGAGQELGFELFWSLGWLLYHLASLFPHCPVEREKPDPAQQSVVISTLCFRRLRLQMQTPH